MTHEVMMPYCVQSVFSVQQKVSDQSCFFDVCGDILRDSTQPSYGTALLQKLCKLHQHGQHVETATGITSGMRYVEPESSSFCGHDLPAIFID